MIKYFVCELLKLYYDKCSDNEEDAPESKGEIGQVEATEAIEATRSDDQESWYIFDWKAYVWFIESFNGFSPLNSVYHCDPWVSTQEYAREQSWLYSMKQ